MQIKLTVVHVSDQDEALDFYRDKLGLQVKKDTAYGPDARWVSLVSPEALDGVELVLAKTDPSIGSDVFQRQQLSLIHI